MEAEDLFRLIQSVHASAVPSEKESDRPTIEVPAKDLLALMTTLKNDARFSFNMLMAHTAVDWEKEGVFELVYLLFSTQSLQYLMVLTEVPRDNPVVSTVEEVWPIAHWQEREVYDLFGVLYDNHSDLRRLFLEDEWEGFPMRKDYKDDFMLEMPK